MHGWITCILIIETNATLSELLPAESSQLLLPILSTLCHSPSKVLSGPGPAGSWPGSTSPKWGLTVPGSAPDPQSIRLSRFAGPRAVPPVTIAAPISSASSPREKFQKQRFPGKLGKLKEASEECSVRCLVRPSPSCQRQARSLEGAHIQVIP